MAKYKPLDLSFISNQYSPNADSIRNTAAMIMANAGWNQPSQVTLKEIAAAQKKAKDDYNSAHKQTFLSSVFDLLSTPLYGVANALDESLAGHQSDSDDSVLEDIAKTAGGVFTGLGRGLGAGLRGASGILDVVPGVDVNDEWQSDPEDKTHFSDVAIRKTTGMSTADAMKPENWDKIKPILQDANNKSIWDKTVFEMAIPDDLEDPDARKKYFRNQMLTGIPVDIGADPLNYLLPGIGSANRAAKATKGITEGLDEARAAENTNPILKGLNIKASRDFTPKAELNSPAPIQALPESVPAGPGFDIPTVESIVSDAFKTPVNRNVDILQRASKAGVAVSGKDQSTLVKQVFNLASEGKKGWMYGAADLLAKHPNVTWTNTEALLQKANDVIGKIGQRGVNGLAPALRKAIAKDVEAARPADEIVRPIKNAGDQIAEVGVAGDKIIKGSNPLKLKASEAKLANQVVRKFESEILGRGRAPGTYEGLARSIASGNNVRYSGPQQARMWNQITSNLKYANSAKFDKAVRILRAVESYYISRGVIPHSWSALNPKDGLPGAVPLRLSQVAEAIGPQVLGKSHAFITGILRGNPEALAQLTPKQIEALQTLRASESIAAAPAAQKGILAGKGAIDDISKMSLSAGRKKNLMDQAIKIAKFRTASEGGGDAAAHVVGEYMGNLLGKGDLVNRALNVNKLKTEAWLGKIGRTTNVAANDPKFVRSVTTAIGRAADLPNPAQLGKLSGPAARVKDWLGARFNAAYGVQDMRQIFLINQASAMSTIGRRAKLLNNLARTFDPKDVDLWHEAFRTAQQNGIADGRVAQLQSEIAKVMENLFGGSGLRIGAIADSTVVGRNRLFLDELNSNLKRFGLGDFKFQAAKVTDAAGVEHDFSKGLDWMKSWQAWDVKKPYEFLHQIQNAIEFTVREKNMFDEIITRFGSPNKHKDVKYGVNHPRLKGYYFTQEGAKQAQQFVRMLEEVSTPNSKALQHFDHVLSKLKASLTIYIPGHHWTNLIGDTYFNWIAGVNKPIRYEQAMKVMLAQKGRYGEFAEVGKRSADSFDALTNPKAMEQAIARSVIKGDAGLNIPAKGNQVIVTMQNGTKVTADMIYTAAYREGILPSARVLEEVSSEVTTVLDKFRPLGGRGQRAVHQVSEVRDHIPRLAQFIDGIAKSRSSFSSAVSSSARSVRKWHPDGIDLTKFERDVMKRVFPFYSWTRKAIPLAIESVIFAGPKVMAYPRLMQAIALSNGIDPEQNTTDMFPGDQMFPDWLRDRGIGPVFGGAGSYGVVNPSTPVLDVLTLLGHPGQSSIDMLNPMGKVPIEAAQGNTLGRNVPIEDYPNYFAKQIPVVSQAGRASGQFGVSDSTKAEGFPNYTNILNLLTGAKRVDTGKYQKSAEFDLRDYLKQKAKQQGR